MNYLILLSPIALILCILLPKRVIAVALGVLLPVDVLGNLDPVMLDGARYGLALLLILRSIGSGRIQVSPSRGFRIAASCLIFIYALSGIKLLWSTDEALGASTPIVGLVSVLMAVFVAGDAAVRRPILIGFVAGSSFSALDIVLQYSGLPFLGTSTLWGTRYAGLSFSSTNVAPFLAIALVLAIMPWLWTRAAPNYLPALFVYRLASGVILAFALILSGGRGGVVGLSFGVFILILNMAGRRVGVFVLVVLSFVLAVLANWERIVWYVYRGDSAADITSGRAERNAAAWEALNSNWVSGIPHTEYSLYNPHTPILLFGLQAGIAGSIAATLVTIVLLRVGLSGIQSKGKELTFAMVACIMFVTALLEPAGFYIGLSKTTLLMIVLASLDGRASSKTRMNRIARNNNVRSNRERASDGRLPEIESKTV